jgi:Phosphate uptake regulator
MVTLPKVWADSIQLKKNDPVSLQVQPDGSLILYPKSVEPEHNRVTKTIDVTKIKDTNFIHRQLTAAYISGCGAIEVISEMPIHSSVLNVISTFTQTCIGIEICESDDNRVLITDLVEHEDINPCKVSDRIKMLIKSMLYDVYDSTQTGEVSDISIMNGRDLEVDRTYWMISRLVNICLNDPRIARNMELTTTEVISCLDISRMMERIGDHAVEMAAILVISMSKNGIDNLDKNWKKTGAEIFSLFNASYICWVGKDTVAAENNIMNAENMIRKIESTAIKEAKSTGLDIVINTVIAHNSIGIIRCCKEICELAVNASMKN